MPVALGAGVVAGIAAFIVALAVARFTTADPGEALDAGGVQAARMLATRNIETWKSTFGSSRGVRSRILNYIDKQAEQAKNTGDSRDEIPINNAVAAFKNGELTDGLDAGQWPSWLAFNKIYPANSGDDSRTEKYRVDGMKIAQANDKGAFIGAGVLDETGSPIVGAGNVLGGGTEIKTVGNTKVFQVQQDGQLYRVYEHPIVNLQGAPGGRALVVLSAAGAKPPDTAMAAAAAGGAAFLGAFLVAWLVGMGPVRSMRKLATDLGNLAGGDLNTRISVRGPDLVQAAAKNAQRVAQLIAEGGHGEAPPPEVITEHVVVPPVEEITQGLKPIAAAPRPAELEIEATSKPAQSAGNDYYDVVQIDADHVGFFIADIPLNGVTGAMYMAQIRALFRAYATTVEDSLSPAAVLRAINRSFAVDLPRGVYVTGMYAVIQLSSGICRVASAQHLPLVFWKLAKKASARLQTEGIALGLDSGAVFDKTIEEKAIQLERGDRIVLYTDGAISARSAQGAQYGEEKFYYVVNRESPKNSAAFVNFVANDVDLFHAGAVQADDFTILTARRVR
jgi:hypothetical protein